MDKVTVGGSGREAESHVESAFLQRSIDSVGFQGAGHNLELNSAHFNNTHGAH